MAVIDDDDLTRLGIESIIRADPNLSLAASLNHSEALADTSWLDTDVILVDAADTRGADDDFPGVDVVRMADRARQGEDPGSSWLVVVTGHYYDDALRRRMSEAGADLFFHRTQLQERDVIARVLSRPEEFRSPVPAADPAVLFFYGVTDRSRVNEGLDFLRSSGLGLEDLDEPPASRSRSWRRTRFEFGRVARVETVNSDGLAPYRDQGGPSRPQMARFVRYFTRAKSRVG